MNVIDYGRNVIQLNPGSTADELNRKVADQLAALRAVPQKLADIVLGYRKKKQQIAGDKMISALAMQQQNKANLDGALAAVDTLQNEAQTALAGAEKSAAAVFGAPKDTQEALLQQGQERAAWERWRRLLDAKGDYTGVVERAAASSDLVGLGVLRAELPVYMESKGQLQPDIDAVLGLLDKLERPLLPDVQRRARDLQDELKTGWYFLGMDFNFVRTELGGNVGAAAILPAWRKSDPPVEAYEHMAPLNPNYTPASR